MRRDDEHGDLAAHERVPEHLRSAESDPLDFTSTNHRGAESGIDALDLYAPAETGDAGIELDALDAQTRAAEEEVTQSEGHEFFTVSNPPGTVSVSALIDGGTHRIDLSATVTTMTESELAGEVIFLAELARQKGLAGQHAYLSENVDLSQVDGIMNDLRLDSTAVLRDFMETGMEMRSPEQTEAARTEMFASRYQTTD